MAHRFFVESKGEMITGHGWPQAENDRRNKLEKKP